ncbi:MAG: divergent polysaccharide deacetylase family protein, partial [Pseudomonadota bacterium]|nr:divergent polysaccharide deacetylase family protein [Pseudomonadota bacterium]
VDQTAPALGATWLAYARSFDQDDARPRIAVVVAGLGLGRAATTQAIKLPASITLAFASHARDLQRWIDLARAAGHEVLLDVPMEPVNYPDMSPGPLPLLTTLSSAENVARLKWHLDRATGYVGVTHNFGSRFTTSADDLRPILSALKVRGLLFLDARTSSNSVAARMAASIGLPTAFNDRFIDVQASRHAIDQRLDEVERMALASGNSVAFSHPFPVTLERLGHWAGALDGETFVLVPISALANRQAIR